MGTATSQPNTCHWVGKEHKLRYDLTAAHQYRQFINEVIYTEKYQSLCLQIMVT
jgi:antirestriction protein ArdC